MEMCYLEFGSNEDTYTDEFQCNASDFTALN